MVTGYIIFCYHGDSWCSPWLLVIPSFLPWLLVISGHVLHDTTITTLYGDVVGTVVDMGTGTPFEDILQFKGIPYGKADRWEVISTLNTSIIHEYIVFNLKL